MAGSLSRARGQKRRHRQVARRRAPGVAGAGAGAGPEVTHPAPARPLVAAAAVVKDRGPNPSSSAAPPAAAHFRFPFPANTRRREEPSGRKRRGEEEEGPWHSRRLRPQAGAGGRAGGRRLSSPRRARAGAAEGRGLREVGNSTQGGGRPQPAPKAGGPCGLLSACEARHGGEADEPGKPSVYGKGGGARAALTTIGSPRRLPFARGAGGTGNASGPVRRRKSSPMGI